MLEAPTPARSWVVYEGYSGVPEESPHPLEIALSRVSQDAPPSDRLEVIWQWYEDLMAEQLDRPPTTPQRAAVAGRLRSDQVPPLYLRRPRLRLEASRTIAEKASMMVQAPCPVCEVLVDANGHIPLMLHTAIDVEPWSAQSGHVANKVIKATVTKKLQEKSIFTPWKGPICISVVSFVPNRVGMAKTKDVDNLVKGVLDSLTGVLYDDDRRIQCLTSRRVDYAGTQGYYLVSARAVYPWDADVVLDDGEPLKRVSGVRIEPPLDRRAPPPAGVIR